MTIKELCEKYNCNITSMYGKLKRKKPELNGHIIMANGIIQIDEYAEGILKPGARQREIRELIEKGKNADWQIERANGRSKIEASKRQESEENVKLLRLENESLKSDLAALSAENQTLLLQIAELKHRIEELEMKPKSIFNRR